MESPVSSPIKLSSLCLAVGVALAHPTLAQDQDSHFEEVVVWGTKVSSNTESMFADDMSLKQADHMSDLLRDIPGVDVGGMSYLAFNWALSSGQSAQYAQTMAFAMLIFAQLWHLFDSRTFNSLYRKNPFTNKYLLGAVAVSATLSLGVIYTGLGQLIFNTEALSAGHLFGVILVSSLPTFILSGIKEMTKTKVV